MKLRSLSPDEIYLLEKQGCTSSDWLNLLVKDPFRPELIWFSSFEGSNVLGCFTNQEEGTHTPKSGIYHSRLINCEIGDAVRIEHVKYLENYRIGDHCELEDIGRLSTTCESSFGNGTELDVLNEAGGRTLPIFDALSAQIAWMVVKARNDSVLIDRITTLIRNYAATKKSAKGSVGRKAGIRNTSSIINVWIGESARLNGVQSLEEGTIRSEVNAITRIGHGVTAKNFIIQEGSEVSGGAILDACFVGQAVKIGKQFSAENSAFFANSECFHGEGCSVFGGPYTVTHHKSTLLIAGQYSFYNAGSGTNQSNHMYKLGPMHQGIVERGSKTGSFSYMLWPSHVGPFSVVMGKHTSSFDAAIFPFSYISEEHSKSVLTPAMNLFTVGTKRDIQKWPARDRRNSSVKFDQIIFDLYSPYIIEKVIKAIETLDSLYQKTPKEQSMVFLNGLHVHRLMLKTCRKYYELALNVFFGEGLLLLLNQLKSTVSLADLHALANEMNDAGTGEWIDAAGLFLPLSAADALIEKIKVGDIKSINDIQDFFTVQAGLYGKYKTSYCLQALVEVHGIDLKKVKKEQIITLIDRWKTASLKLNNMIIKDAEKEFDATSHIGYGISSKKEVRESDFNEVHGHFEDNGFIKGLRAEIELIEQKAQELIDALD